VKKERGQVVDMKGGFIGRLRGMSRVTSGSGEDLGRVSNQSVTVIPSLFSLKYDNTALVNLSVPNVTV